jgi:hypothetical protein
LIGAKQIHDKLRCASNAIVEFNVGALTAPLGAVFVWTRATARTALEQVA